MPSVAVRLPSAYIVAVFGVALRVVRSVAVRLYSRGGRFYAPSFVGASLPSACIALGGRVVLPLCLYSVGWSGRPRVGRLPVPSLV